MAKISKAEIDAIKAANSESIEKFKSSKKKSAGGRPKSPQSAETNAKSKAAIDDTIAELSRQMGVPSSNNPSAPQGIGQAARPSNAPRGGTSTAQSAVAQINFAAQQMNTTTARPYTAYDINRDIIRDHAQSVKGIQQGFNYAVQGKAPMSQKDRIAYGKASYDDIRDAAAARDNSLKNAVRMAIKEDSKQILKTLDEEAEKESRSNAPRRSQASGNGGGGFGFRARQTYHLLGRAATIASQIGPDNSPQSVYAPMQEAIAAITPLLPAAFATPGYAAAAIFRITQAGIQGADNTADAGMQRGYMKTAFANNRNFDFIANKTDKILTGNMTPWEKAKAGLSSLPLAQYLDLDWNGDFEQKKNKVLQETLSGYEKMSSQSYLYGNEYDTAVSKWESKNKRRVDAHSLRMIASQVTRKKQDEMMNSPAFMQEMATRAPAVYMGAMLMLEQQFGLHGKLIDPNKIRQENELNLLNDIATGKVKNVGGEFTLAQKREAADLNIEELVWKKGGSWKTEEEAAKNVELRAKAERHRHLAEF